MTTPVVDIVVPCFDQPEFTAKCLDSIRATTKPGDFRVILIDNGSSPESSAVYLEKLDGMQHWYCKLESNTGFVKATNCGLAVSTAPYVLLLNNDTELPPNWLEKMLEVMEAEPRVGIVGPLSSSAHQWQGQVGKGGVGWHVLGLHQMLSFFCALIRRQVIVQCGYLSEEFRAGLGDDDDYAQIIHRSGWRLALRMDVEVLHHHRTSFRAVYGEGGWHEMQKENLEFFKKKWNIP